MSDTLRTYTTDRIDIPTIVLLPLYAVLAEFFARCIILAGYMIWGVRNGTIPAADLIAVPIVAPFWFNPVLAIEAYYGLSNVDFFARVSTTDAVAFIAATAVAYALAVGALYGVHRRFVSP